MEPNDVVTITVQVEWQKLLYRLMGLPDGRRHLIDIDIDRTGRPDRLVIHETGRIEVLTRKS